MQLSDSQYVEWFPDTRASAHITADVGTFTNLIPIPWERLFYDRSGKCLPISHVGEGKIINVTTNLPLENILLTPVKTNY